MKDVKPEMKRKDNDKNSRGINKALGFYGILVLILILGSLTIRLFSLIRESKFDGQHRFTLVIGEDLSAGRQGGRVLGLISFEPTTSSLALVTLTHDSDLSFSSFDRKLGIIPDGYIKTKYNLSLNDTAALVLQSLLLHYNSVSTDINIYDLLRFYLYANKIPSSTVEIEEISASSDATVLDKAVLLLLADSAMSSENVSVQIVNAAGQSGLGGRLERVLSNLGGNVVSVRTAMKRESTSKIQFFGKETYTLQKLSRLLPMKREVLEKETIAKIVIILGEDYKNTPLF